MLETNIGDLTRFYPKKTLKMKIFVQLYVFCYSVNL